MSEMDSLPKHDLIVKEKAELVKEVPTLQPNISIPRSRKPSLVRMPPVVMPLTLNFDAFLG
jgi:hypothetical protein